MQLNLIKKQKTVWKRAIIYNTIIVKQKHNNIIISIKRKAIILPAVIIATMMKEI